MTVAARLKKARHAAGFSQTVLARLSGVPLRTITNLEQGIARKPQLATATRLAEALKIKLEDLTGGTARGTKKATD